MDLDLATGLMLGPFWTIFHTGSVGDGPGTKLPNKKPRIDPSGTPRPPNSNPKSPKPTVASQCPEDFAQGCWRTPPG